MFWEVAGADDGSYHGSGGCCVRVCVPPALHGQANSGGVVTLTPKQTRGDQAAVVHGVNPGVVTVLLLDRGESAVPGGADAVQPLDVEQRFASRDRVGV